MRKRREDSPVMKVLIQQLNAGKAMTARSLAEHTQLTERNAKHYIEAAVELGHAHIAKWVRLGARGRWVPEIKAGAKESAPYPTR